MDQNENIYIPFSTYNFVNGIQAYPNAVFFGHSFTIPADGAALLIKLDKNFNILKSAFGDNNDAVDYLAYQNGKLYSAGGVEGLSDYLTDTLGSIASMSPQNFTYRVYQLDTGTLAPIWASSPSYTSNTNENYITASSRHVFMSASITGLIVWDGDTVRVPSNTQWQALFKFDNQTGHCVGIYVDSQETSYNNITTMITADAQENILIGGQFTDLFSWGGNTLTTWGGAQSPIFFMEKWGIDCSDNINTADNPYPPASLVATAQGAHNIDLQWNDNSPYRISFHIYRSPDGLSNWQLVDTTLSAQTTLSDAGLQPHTWYWYKVAAWNVAGESDYTNIDSAVTADSITGISTLQLNNLTIYPNPAHDNLMIDARSDKSQQVQIEITDVTGSKVIEQQYSLTEGENIRTINIGHLTAGYYDVSITANGARITTPIIKF